MAINRATPPFKGVVRFFRWASEVDMVIVGVMVGVTVGVTAYPSKWQKNGDE